MVCDRCHRPKPQTCLCDSLPPRSGLVTLRRTEVVVLQHPLEVRNHKAASHRSVPLLELVLDGRPSLRLCTGRRLGEESLGKPLLDRMFRTHPNHDDDDDDCLPVLVFPKLKVSVRDKDVHGNTTTTHTTDNSNTNTNKNTNTNTNNEYYREDEATVLSLKGLLKKLENDDNNVANTNNDDNDSAAPRVPPPPLPPPPNKPKKIVLLVLDATWRHAREMHVANIRAGMYPPHMLRLALEKEDLCFDDNDNDGAAASGPAFRPGRFRLRGKASKKGYKKKKKHNSKNSGGNDDDDDDDNNDDDDGNANANGNGNNNNNEYDEPIDETWMSTAECIAWIVSKLEATANNKHSEHKNNNNNNESSPSGSDLYEILLKPLDAMVNKWKSYMDKAAASKNSKQKQQQQQQKQQQQQQQQIDKE